MPIAWFVLKSDRHVKNLKNTSQKQKKTKQNKTKKKNKQKQKQNKTKNKNKNKDATDKGVYSIGKKLQGSFGHFILYTYNGKNNLDQDITDILFITYTQCFNHHSGPFVGKIDYKSVMIRLVPTSQGEIVKSWINMGTCFVK